MYYPKASITEKCVLHERLRELLWDSFNTMTYCQVAASLNNGLELQLEMQIYDGVREQLWEEFLS